MKHYDCHLHFQLLTECERSDAFPRSGSFLTHESACDRDHSRVAVPDNAGAERFRDNAGRDHGASADRGCRHVDLLGVGEHKIDGSL